MVKHRLTFLTIATILDLITVFGFALIASGQEVDDEVQDRVAQDG